MTTRTTPGSTAKERTPSSTRKPKTPLRKEELEKIAQELKKKLSRASVAAKQSLTSNAAIASHQMPPHSPSSSTVLPKSSPLKNYYMWRRQIANGTQSKLTSSPSLCSPGKKSPIRGKQPVYLSSSPIKTFSNTASPGAGQSRKSSVGSDSFANDSPIKRHRAQSGAVMKPHEPHMVLKEIDAPSRHTNLHSSPMVSSNQQGDHVKKQTTPTMARKYLNEQPFISQSLPAHSLPVQASFTQPPSAMSSLLKTPTRPGKGDVYNDNEGADLLMYLATSPSVPNSYTNTPRRPSTSAGSQNVAHATTTNAQKPHMNGNQFIAPPPPHTPNRSMTSAAKTPQNRLTPSMFGSLAVPGNALPSSGVALTPAGFNMNDYVNFFTPSPGAVAMGHGSSMTGRLSFKTPDYQGSLFLKPQTPVDGKMINFDKPELFGSAGSDPGKH